MVYWTVDPSRPEGVVTIARSHLRAALFHHFHRLVRLQRAPSNTLMDHVVGGGLAVAFERDSGGRAYPWSEYPANVEEWVKELMALPPTASLDHYMFRHPDVRRWIGLRAGTYVVDQALRASGKTAADLVSASTDEVLRLAGAR